VVGDRPIEEEILVTGRCPSQQLRYIRERLVILVVASDCQ